MPNYFLSSMLFSHELIQYMLCTYSCVLYRKYYHKQKSLGMRAGEFYCYYGFRFLSVCLLQLQHVCGRMFIITIQ